MTTEARLAWGERGRLVGAVAAAGAGLLTAQILILHSAGGRSTSLATAGAWAIASVGIWASLALPGLAAAERLAEARHRPLGLIPRYLGFAAVLLGAAVTLRAAVDPILPAGAARDLPFVDLWLLYAARWSGPGLLAAALIGLGGYLRVGSSARAAAAAGSGLPAAGEPAEAAAPLDCLVVRVGSRSVTLPVETIVAFEASGNYAKARHQGGWLAARITMAELERRLDPARFIRVHRSAIVAIDAVAEVRAPRGRGASLALRDGTELPVSRLGRRELEGRLGHRG